MVDTFPIIHSATMGVQNYDTEIVPCRELKSVVPSRKAFADVRELTRFAR